MNNISLKYLVTILLTLGFLYSNAQTFEIRTAENDNGYLTVQMRETSGTGTPTTATNIVDITFVVRYPSGAVDMDLICSTNNYNIMDGLGGVEQTFGAYDYHYWNASSTPFNSPNNWTLNIWEDIAIFKVTDATGSGLFEIAPDNWDGRSLNWNQEGADYTPSFNGNVNYAYPTLVYNLVWTGNDATNPTYWDVAGNWETECGNVGSIPTAIDNCIIPLVASGNYPINFGDVSSGGQQPTCNNLRINADVSWNLEDADVASSAQVTYTVNNKLSVYGAVNVTPSAQLTIGGDLYLDAAECLLVQANSSGTGSLIVNNTSMTNGTVQVQKYIAGHNGSAAHGWHFLSSAVSAQSIADFHTPGSGNDFFKWDEATETWINRTASGGTLNADFETNFDIGKGYLIANTSDNNFAFSGDLNTFDLEISGLSNNGSSSYSGWNLLGNPFSSAINWNTSNGDWELLNVDALCQIWEEATASYTVISPSEVIPMGNGFMVHASVNNASLTIPVSSRTHNNASWYKDYNCESDRIVLRVADTLGNTAQKTILEFEEVASVHYNPATDSYFMAGYAPQLYSISQNSNYALKQLPLPDDATTIPLGFVKNSNNYFALELSENTTGMNIYLVDTKQGNTHYLGESCYYFSAQKNDNPDRFYIRFIATDPDAGQTQNPAIWYAENNVYMSGVEDYSVFDLLDVSGRVIQTSELDGQGFQGVAVHVPTGIYLARLKSGTTVFTKKVLIK